jgi:hypothetical protein
LLVQERFILKTWHQQQQQTRQMGHVVVNVYLDMCEGVPLPRLLLPPEGKLRSVAGTENLVLKT